MPTRVPSRYLPAIRREGGRPGFDRWARKRYGVSGSALLAKLGMGESHFNPNAVSSADARKEYQFIPSTRAGLLRETGVDAYGPTIGERTRAARIYVRRGGLEGYNPGDPSYPDYILRQRVGNVGGGRRRTGGRGTHLPQTRARGRSEAPAATDAPQALQGLLGAENGSEGLAGLLAQLQEEQRPQAPTSAPALAPFDARRFLAMPEGFQPPAAAPPQQQGPSLAEMLASVATPGDDIGPPAPSPEEVPAAGPAGDRPTRRPPRSSGRYPLRRRGQIIGTPHAGTHTLGNWQSDNAVDIRIAPGTPVIALSDGVIAKTGGQSSQQGRFGGFNATLDGKGNAWFYAHLSRLSVKPGQRVRRGQVIGYSGSANGVPHLHLGQQRGRPRY